MKKEFYVALLKKVLFIIPFIFLLAVSGFSQTQKAPIEPRRLALSILNLEDKPDYAIGWIHTAYHAGCNTVIISIPWDRVYYDKNSKANWALFDKQIKFATDLGMSVALRIHLGRHRSRIEGFWDNGNGMTDFKGFPATFNYDNSHISYASDKAVNRVSEFITEVADRYKPYQQKGQILFVGITTTPDQESGYFYKNQQYPGPEYDAIYDFSKPAMSDLQAQMEKKYKNVNTLNKYWITKYLRFDQAVPYINTYNPSITFIGKRGKDFYMARHNQLKSFLKATGEVVKKVDPGYKICYEFGSMTDQNTEYRGVYNVTSVSEFADYIKHNDELKEWSFDILGHNIVKPIYNEIFPYETYKISDMVGLTDWYFTQGSSLVSYVVANDEKAEIFRQVLEKTKHWITEPIRPITATKKMDIYVSQLIDNYAKLLSRWKDLSLNGKERVAINLIEDILEEEKIDFLPYKSPEELAKEYGYYGNGNDTTGGTQGGGTGNPPPPPNPQDTTNLTPFAQRKYTPKPLIIKQLFVVWFDNDIFIDTDGYITSIEMVEGPKWLTFRRDGFFFMGTAPALGKYKVKLRAFDNRNAWTEDTFEFEVVPPTIDFYAIEANYFDVPIREVGGVIDENETMFLSELPSLINIVAKCNVDSISLSMELSGPFYKESLSLKPPFNIFGEGRGFVPPIGTYQLTAHARKGDSLITKRTISFTFYETPELIPVADWIAYPNPFDDVCNVKIPDTIDPAQLSFTLTEVSGKQTPVYADQVKTVGQTVYIDFRRNHLNHGTYFLRIDEKGKKSQLKRIIKR